MGDWELVLEKVDEYHKTIDRLKLGNAFYAGMIAGVLICLALLLAGALAKWSMGL